MRYFIDTEFNENGETVDLISIAIVCEDGREFYAESQTANLDDVNDWVRENVLPHLTGPVRPRHEIARGIVDFVGADPKPQFWGYYCVAPNVRLLRSDMQWVDAAQISIGDRVVGFDEFPREGAGRSSRWRTWKNATVTSTKWLTKPCFDLVFEDGTTVRSSADHLWLTAAGRVAKWTRTADLVCNGPHRASNVVKPLDAWDVDDSRSAGYLAAALDGEGHITQTCLEDKERGVYRCRIGFAQKDNAMLRLVKEILEAKNLRYIETVREDGLHNLIIGNRPDVMRCLGAIRPVRLLANFDPAEVGAMSGRVVKLASKTFAGDCEVVAIETDTKTFIAEGLASHNCSYDWVAFCQLFGRMIDLPKGWPMYCRDIKQFADDLGNPDLPPHSAKVHHALEDARWNMRAWTFLTDRDERLATRLAELERSFELAWDCDRRATRMWQAETGQDLTWPDGAKLTVWLLRKLHEHGVHLPERDKVDTAPVTRFEVIEEAQRALVRKGVCVDLDYQDDGRTLKVFIKPMKEGGPL